MSRNTFTLLEIVFGVVLLSIIILGAASFGSASEYFLQSSSRKSVVVNEMTYIIEHIAKYTAVATGDVANLPTSQGITAAGATLTIRYDINGTPADYSDDLTARYTLAGNDLTFQRDFHGNPGNIETLSSRVTAFDVSRPLPNQVSINDIIVRYDLVVAIDDRTNPELALDHDVILSSFCHSTN